MPEWSRETPWRQGSLLTDTAAIELGLIQAGRSQLVIVASHDCDLTQSPEVEPQVEVIVGTCIDRIDGNCSHGKSSRRLHLEFNGIPITAEFEATNKAAVSKELLANYQPNTNSILSPENSHVFQFWLGSRYHRSAFPDEFERRLKEETKLAKKIARAVEPHGSLIVGIFFDVDQGEEVDRTGEDDTYTLDIYILHQAEPDFHAAEAAATQAADRIVNNFREKLFNPTRTWKQIELRSCEVISESVLTYQEFKQLKRWRLDYISLSDVPQQPTIAE